MGLVFLWGSFFFFFLGWRERVRWGQVLGGVFFVGFGYSCIFLEAKEGDTRRKEWINLESPIENTH